MRKEKRQVQCLACQQMQAVPAAVSSWQCEKCGATLDFKQHTIDGVESTRIQTYGGVIITPKGRYVGQQIQAGWVQLAGTCSASLILQEKFIVDGAEAILKGKVQAPHIEIHKGAFLKTEQKIETQTMRIEGKLEAKYLTVSNQLTIASTSDVQLNMVDFGSIRIEPGARVQVKRANAIQENREVFLSEL